MSRTLIVFINNVGQSRVMIKETGLRVTCESCKHYGVSFYDHTARYAPRCHLLGVSITVRRTACTAHEDKP